MNLKPFSIFSEYEFELEPYGIVNYSVEFQNIGLYSLSTMKDDLHVHTLVRTSDNNLNIGDDLPTEVPPGCRHGCRRRRRGSRSGKGAGREPRPTRDTGCRVTLLRRTRESLRRDRVLAAAGRKTAAQDSLQRTNQFPVSLPSRDAEPMVTCSDTRRRVSTMKP